MKSVYCVHVSKYSCVKGGCHIADALKDSEMGMGEMRENCVQNSASETCGDSTT